MIMSARNLIDYTVTAGDEPIGKVVDLYFDEDEWQVRYVVVQMDQELTERTILVSPYAVQEITEAQETVQTDLTREKILSSPDADTQLPVSRQYEAALHRYYEWPEYWGQTSFMDTSQIKYGESSHIPYEENIVPSSSDRESPEAYGEQTEDRDPELAMAASEPEGDGSRELEFGAPEEESVSSPALRSVRETATYAIRTSDNYMATTEDLLIDDLDGWSVRFLVARVDYSADTKRVLLPVQMVENTEWDAAEHTTSLSGQALEDSPTYRFRTGEVRQYEKELYRYYDEHDLA